MELGRKILSWSLLSLGALVLGGFQASEAGLLDWMGLGPKPTVIHTTFIVSPRVNPDSFGNPRSIKVRLYALKSLDVFESHDYLVLKSQDQDLLGDEIKLRKLRTFKPGEQREETFSIPPDKDKTLGKVLYVAVVAFYRDLAQAEWRATGEVRVGKKNALVVHLNRLRVTLEKAK